MPIVPRSEVDFGTYDVIIAGSGPAGGGVAESLSAKNAKVLVLETGGEEFDGDVQDAFGTVAGWGHYDGAYWGSHWMRMLGGTSNLWGGWCAPLSDRNLSDWPITRADLDPYYVSAAETLSVPLDVIGFERDVLGSFFYRQISVGPPLRFSDPLRFPTFRFDDNVDVLLRHSLGPLRPNEARNGVESFSLYSLADGTSEDIPLTATQSLVLAAGGMGNAQILLGSTGGSDTSLGNETGQVGRYLQDHPHVFAGKVICRKGALVPELPEDLDDIRNILVPKIGLYDQAGGLDVCLILQDSTIDSGDPMEVFLQNKLGGVVDAYGVDIMAQMTGRPENRVTATDALDPSGLPLLSARCTIDAPAREAIDTVVRALGAELLASDLGRLRIDADSIFTDTGGGGHTMGTTRMGTDPASSVVDADCRVHGYRNLYVAGSSVFSSGGSLNPTLTIVALAHRLADHLTGDA